MCVFAYGIFVLLCCRRSLKNDPSLLFDLARLSAHERMQALMGCSTVSLVFLMAQVSVVYVACVTVASKIAAGSAKRGAGFRVWSAQSRVP